MYIGVHFSTSKRNKSWVSSIGIHKRTIQLGYFKTELEAAKDRDSFIIENNLQGYTLNFKEI